MAPIPYISSIVTGTVDEFIDGALLILVILIIWYLLKFIFMFGEGGRGGVGGRRWGFNTPRDFLNWVRDPLGRRPRGGGGGGGGGAPGGPPNFTPLLDQIAQLLNRYRLEFQIFRTACNAVLQTHYNYMNSGGYYAPTLPPVSAAQWQAVMDSLTRLNQLDQQINGLLNQIRTDPNFAQIIPGQRTRLITLTTDRANVVNTMQTFYLDFLNRYGTVRLPAP